MRYYRSSWRNVVLTYVNSPLTAVSCGITAPKYMIYNRSICAYKKWQKAFNTHASGARESLLKHHNIQFEYKWYIVMTDNVSNQLDMMAKG